MDLSAARPKVAFGRPGDGGDGGFARFYSTRFAWGGGGGESSRPTEHGGLTVM